MEKGRITILYSCYSPDNAPTNRLLSLLKGMDCSGYETEVVFIYPDRRRSKLCGDYKRLTVRYLWSDGDSTANIPKYIKSFFTLRRFARTLPKGTRILVIGGSKYLHLFTSRGDIVVFHERTEHPIAVDPLPGLLQKRYYRACRSAAGIFCITTEGKRVFEQELCCRNVRIINMTVDSSRFENLPRASAQPRYIAYCGTASNNKDGVDELLKAFAIVHKSLPDVELHIMGRTPSSKDRNGNLALIESLGIGEKVVFEGIVPADRMPFRLQAASVLALSRPDSLQARGGFPTKLGEYLLTANPVVVTAVGDIPLFLEDGRSAYLCPDRDAERFASALVRALTNNEEASRIGEAGRKVALKHFNCLTEGAKMAEAMILQEPSIR